MKILHIIAHLGLGGAQTIVKGLFEHQQNNPDIFLFALRKREVSIEIQHENIICYDGKARYSFAPLKELQQVMLKEKIDIVHCHLFRSLVLGFILKNFYFPHTALIFHEHGAIIGRGENSPLENYLYRKFVHMAAPKVNIYIAVSHTIKNILVERGNISKDKIVTLYNFVDLARFSPEKLTDNQRKKEPLGIREDDFVVGFAGRIVERKGWREYVEAAKILSRMIPNIKFLIAGDGPERHHLLHLIERYHLHDKIFFLGYIADMLQFYSYLDCFVMPSQWEPMGIIELEVQACGIPVVASNVPGLNEIIQHNYNGLLCEVKNKFDLAEKIKIIYSNQQIRKRLIANGLRSVKQYSFDKFLLGLNRIYAKCING